VSFLSEVERLTVSETDSALLKRFVDQRDEKAFAQILQRHGPMVFATCMRVLQNEADAEDVFQATFLALAKNPPPMQRGTTWAPISTRWLTMKR
jgi:DNA-directed RNA polymerase specialized sigma24 family protein